MALALALAVGCAGGGAAPGASLSAAGEERLVSPLAPCPRSPNCVSSDAADAAHHVDPFVLAVAPEPAWRLARDAVAGLPGCEIVEESAARLHAVCTTRILRFRDDLELELRPAAGEIAVRSASRVGYSDLGANRRRVERLRERLRERGVVR